MFAIPLTYFKVKIEDCIMARIHVEHVHEAHMTEDGQLINLRAKTGSSGGI